MRDNYRRHERLLAQPPLGRALRLGVVRLGNGRLAGGNVGRRTARQVSANAIKTENRTITPDHATLSHYKHDLALVKKV